MLLVNSDKLEGLNVQHQVNKIFNLILFYYNNNNCLLFKSHISLLLSKILSGQSIENKNNNQLTIDYYQSQRQLYEDKNLNDSSLKPSFYHIPEKWIWIPVHKLGEVVIGNTPPSHIKEYYGNEYPFFKPADLNAGYYTITSKNRLSNKGIKQARLLPEFSVLVVCIGATIGKTALIRTKGALNQQINAIIPNREIVIPEYLYYWFSSPFGYDTIIKNAVYTTLPILKKSQFQNLLVVLPPLHQQKEIVKKLDAKHSFLLKLSTNINNIMILLNSVLIKLEKLRFTIINYAFVDRLK